jgi:hypothetical protein
MSPSSLQRNLPHEINMPRLGKHSILAAADALNREIEVPEWGGSVWIKTLNVAEGIAFNDAKANVHEEKVVPLLLTYVLCEEDGKPLFNQDDTDQLCAKNPAVLLRIFHEAVALNKMNKGADDEREEKS